MRSTVKVLSDVAALAAAAGLSACVSESSKLKPFSDGTTSIVYSRDDGESKDTGKQYPAYSDTQDLVLK